MSKLIDLAILKSGCCANTKILSFAFLQRPNLTASWLFGYRKDQFSLGL